MITFTKNISHFICTYYFLGHYQSLLDPSVRGRLRHRDTGLAALRKIPRQAPIVVITGSGGRKGQPDRQRARGLLSCAGAGGGGDNQCLYTVITRDIFTRLSQDKQSWHDKLSQESQSWHDKLSHFCWFFLDLA